MPDASRTDATPHGARSLAAYAEAPYRYDARYRLAGPADARPYAREIAEAAHQAGVDPELVHALVAVESAYRADAVSAKGAVGLMQLLPETARAYGVRDVAAVSGATGAADNLRAGSRYLRDLLDRFGQRLDLALAAYNAGEGAVRRYANQIPPYPETQGYVPAVFAHYRAHRPESRPVAP
ncbi:transglycosylase SLT domain-containing protein [Rhodocyclus tenuis]|uniref:Transglycosylase SLT domain-containing protein n=1 Tax=Rhodocyclus tenuis TaxID=1066 RepID=A0A6L5K0D8_RHOTE|nr:lytic transglycosylase domain-containing protein [Rhodocyclus gracilis]MQY52300.1 transglycosylase SLT domain-containing protein [Rhodocyclus gracilis]MRD73888.1 transglycosylase SLT domain-containing protein [Rhodocyclus gracilis]